MKCKIDFNVQPIFDTEELAKVYYETDVLAKGNFTIIPDLGKLIVLKNEWNTGDTFDLFKYPCIFKDENGNCLIGKYKPQFCKSVENRLENNMDVKDTIIEELNDIDKNIPLITNLKNSKHLRIIKPFTKHDLKDLKWNSVIYYLVYCFQRVNIGKLDIGLKTDYEYVLVFIKEKNKKRVTAIRLLNVDCENEFLKPYIKIYNKLNKYSVLKDYDYIQLIMNRLNRLLNGISFTEIPEEILKKSPIEKEKRDELIKFVYWLVLIQKMITEFKIPFISRYLREIENDSKMLLFLAIYYLYEALTDEKLELKSKEEITINDLIPKNKYVEEVLSIIDKIASSTLKAFIMQK